ncbi:hypothetical protein GCM10010401_07020 [Rarobacter faecitabidus]|uniref:Uncharacterized protein n=1 Tax=Rarobacter faecitabidus TaxID=13243 RepID=A0A542ZTJ9_RARFA|nr:hypothetical protein [Rarobacter faecitabidus]TQL63550.1 hypothetical protein FB461_0009 [Rarobacter faecitabidus]
MTTTTHAAGALTHILITAAEHEVLVAGFTFDRKILTIDVNGDRYDAERLADALECLRAPDETSILDLKTLRWIGTVACVDVRIEVVE